MADSGGTKPDSLNRGKWENFEEESGDISDRNGTEISASREEPNNFSGVRSELISEQKALRQQGNSSLNKESGVTGTGLSENLEERSETTDEVNTSLNSRGAFDLEGVDASNRVGRTGSDQVNDIALGVRESTSQSNEGGLTTPSQSNDVSANTADGSADQVNGESDSHLNFHPSSVAAVVDSKGIADKTITLPTSQWTTFEDSRKKDLTATDEAAKIGKTERSSAKTSDENHTPLPLKSMTSNMAAFDARQAAATTNIIPNLAAVTESDAVKPNSVSSKTSTSAPNVSNAEKSMKSAVPIVANIVSTLSNSSSIQQECETVDRGNAELGKNWVSFGEERNSNASQQKSNKGDSASVSEKHESSNLETAKRPDGLSQQRSKQDIVAPFGNKTQTTNAISSQSENKTTSVMPPVSFTSAELDLLASKSWIKFEDSNKTSGNHVQPPSSSAQSWVTFGDSSAPVGQNLDILELDVSSKVKTSSVPSPNPFVSATPPVGSNPFKPATTKPATTNPFQADNTASVTESPYPALNQGPISSSTPVTATKTLVVSESVAAVQPSITRQGVATGDSVFASSTANMAKPELTIDQEHVDARAVVLNSQEQKPLPQTDEPLLEEKAVISGSWSMLLRFPDKKRKIGSREWKPVVVKLEGTTLQIFEEYELSAPFREIPLQAYFVFTDPKLQSFEHGAKVHTVKLEYVKYTEGRSLRHRGTIEHIAQGTTIIKIASPSHRVIRQLLESFNSSLRLLPSYRDRGITYRHDEVFVDIDDVTNVLLSGDGTILRKNAKVQIRLRAFLTGDPECQLVLNDVVVREREEARLRGELKPQRVHHWVKLRHCDFHKCVNTAAFDKSHAITFHPLDACTFELMRFPVDHHKPLPLLVKTTLNIHSEQRIELKAEIQVCQETKMAKYVRSNVVFRFPIPESWVPLFRTGKVFRGERSIKSSKGRRAAGIKSRLKHSKCSIGVSLGKAMYEPEYGSVVWRIDHLPYIHSKIPADAPQTITVVLDLPPGMEFPENYKPTAELEYDVAYVLVSDTTVIAVKVSNQNIPDKWVCYRALYHYDVNIDISRPSSGPVRDVGCTQQ